MWTSYYITLLVALLLDTLQHPRWNCYVILVTRCVLLYSYRNVDVPVTNNLVTCPARRWRTSRCMSGRPRVYLSHRRSSNSRNYSIQNIGILSGKHEGHLYNYSCHRATFEDLVTSISYPSLYKSCGQTIFSSGNTIPEKVPITYWRCVSRYIIGVYPTYCSPTIMFSHIIGNPVTTLLICP